MLHPFWTVAIGAALLGACTGDGQGSTDSVVTTTFPTTPTTTDTGWPPGDVGNFMVDYNVNEGTTSVFGVAASSPPNYPNLSQCGALGTVCIGSIPTTEDTFQPFDPDVSLDRETVKTRYLGYSLNIGPFEMSYREDPDSGYGSYLTPVSTDPLEPGWYPVTWGGQWPSYDGGQDLYVPPPIQLITPQVDGFLQVTNGSKMRVEWVPTGEGFVTLAVVPSFGDGTMYLLHDDGYFEVNTDDLGLGGDIEDFDVVLSRWYVNETQHFGHVVDFVAKSDVQFSGQLLNIGGRTEIEPANKCAEAEGSLPLGAGEYWGTNAGQSGELDPTNGCLGTSFYADAAGNDSIVRLQVGSHHMIGVDYNMPDRSASVYFLTDCNDASTCFQGSDLYPDVNIHEYLSYFNYDDDPATIYLVLDGTDNEGEPVYTLDITDEYLGEPPAYDQCADAQGAAVVPPGAYYSEFVAYTGQLNPGTGGCTASSTPGPDLLIPVEIPAGANWTANVNMPDGDPALYLVFNCNDAFSCAAGSDGSLGETEDIAYTNGTAYTQRAYLVVDSKSGLKPFFISFQ